MVPSPKRLPEILTREEALKLLSEPNKRTPTGLRNRLILQLMYRAGLRVGEIVALAPKDIDYQEGILRVFRGKGAKDRTLYLHEHTVDLLRLWEARRPQGSRYLFCTLQGKALSDRYIRAMVRRYGQRAGLTKRVHPHMLRHSFATELLQEGYNIREVQKLLGHSDLSSTMLYTHIFDSELRDKLRRREPLAV